MLTKDLKKTIADQKYTFGEKLPSIRKMASQLGVSAGTISKVYNELMADGLIKAYPGKGVFWGECTTLKKKGVTIFGTLSEMFSQDLENGVYSIFSPLPSLKELSIHYKTSLYHIRNFVNQLVEQGLLRKIGARYLFNREQKHESSKYIIFIHRGDSHGHFYIEAGRELEVFRILSDYTQKQKIAIRYLAYCEDSHVLLTTDGTEYHPTNDPNCLGAFISTWLVLQPSVLFAHFAKCDYPISVWWESPISELPQITRNKKKWAYYDVAFNENPGIIVGKYLRERGITTVNYLSPFHSSEWSKKRLEGLKKENIHVVELTDDRHSSPFDAIDYAKKINQDPSTYLRSFLEELIVNKIDAPFICVNDWIAVELIEILQSRNEKRPHIIGFDNTSESYQYGFDSFAFNVETMVKDALFHIISPKNYANFKKQVQNPPGSVIVKSF